MSTHDAERWTRIQHVLLDALEREPGERAAFLAEECGDDAELRAEVESLIAAHERTDAIGMLDDDAEPMLPAERIGPYRLIRRLGTGGMGTVYLAEREAQDFRQMVALKLIRAGFADTHLDERLRSERRILARLEHPGIARLIDGGVTPWGQPYYAMEYVAGIGLLEYCDAERLRVRERIRLFLRVCDAVQHAHQQLVVHRDLKPGNILVTEDGQPKLLDFGIAKLLDAEDSDTTRTAPWVTPAYASPEQMSGEPAGIASDVYALGVLLYELLTGRRPYELDGRSPVDVAFIICDVQPARPSTVDMREDVLAARSTMRERFRKDVAGDLDTIVLKALAKEPTRRYTSAEHLAVDLRRYLDDRPVLARPDTLRYRAGKFVKRNRALVTAASLGAFALVAGTVVALWQADRATEQAALAAAARDAATEEARKAQLVSALMIDLFRLNDPGEALGDTITARVILDRGTARIETEFDDQPDIQARLLLEVSRIYRNLGLLPRAASLGERAVTLREQVSGPRSLEASVALAQLGSVLAVQGQRDGAIERFRRALSIREEHFGETPDSVMAQVQTELAWQLRARGDHDEAGTLFEQALATQRAIFGEDAAETGPALLGLASAYHDGGRFDAAEALFQSVVARADTTRPHPLAATAMLNVGMLRRLREQYVAAEPLLRLAYEMRTALYDPEHPDVLEAATEWGRVLADLGRYTQSERVLSDALSHAITALGPAHDRVSSLRQSLAAVLSDLGRYPESIAHFDTVIAAKRARHGGDHAEVLFALLQSAEPLVNGARPQAAESRMREAIAMAERMGGGGGTSRLLATRGLAAAARVQGRLEEATRHVDEALRIAAETLREDHRYAREALRVKAEILLDRGRPAEAKALLEALVTANRRVLADPHPHTGFALARLAEAQLALGEAQDAEQTSRDALGQLDTLPATHWRVGTARTLLGAALALQGRAADARLHLEEGLRIVRAGLGDDALETRKARQRAAVRSPPGG